MEILYCEKCGKRVSDKALSEGGAVRIEDKVYCTGCKGSPEKSESLAATVATPSGSRLNLPSSELHRTIDDKALQPSRKSGSFRNASKRTAADPKASPPAKSPAVIAAFVAVPVVIVALLLVLGRGEKPEARSAKNTTKPADPASKSNEPVHAEMPRTPSEPDTQSSNQNPAAQAALKPPSKTVEKSPEDRAGDALEIVLRYEGLAATDKEGRIRALESFLEKYGDTIVAARARRALSELKAPPKSVPATEAGPVPDANDADEPSSQDMQIIAGPYKFEHDAEGWQGDGTPLTQGTFLGRTCLKATPGGPKNVCRCWRGNQTDANGFRIKFRYYAHNLENVEVLFSLEGNRPRKGVTGFTNDKWMWATISAQEFNLTSGAIAHVEIGGTTKDADAFLLIDDVTWEKK